MPTPKRWFPVSREINDDHELWEFTDLFGKHSLRFWLEILSILDRNDNTISLVDKSVCSIARKVRQTPASARRMIGWILAKHWLVIGQLTEDGSPSIGHSPNFSKYRSSMENHRSRHVLPPTDRPTDHKKKSLSTTGDNSGDRRISKQEAEDILTRLNISPKVLEDV
jgi:hypothetical protein